MRATIDLDDPTPAEVGEAWLRLTQFGDGHVFGRVSSSGEGVHLKVHGCDPAESWVARIECGDDLKRIEFDADTRLKPKQIMFSSKPANGEAGEWTRDIDEVMTAYRAECDDAILYPPTPTLRRS